MDQQPVANSSYLTDEARPDQSVQLPLQSVVQPDEPRDLPEQLEPLQSTEPEQQPDEPRDLPEQLEPLQSTEPKQQPDEPRDLPEQLEPLQSTEPEQQPDEPRDLPEQLESLQSTANVSLKEPEKHENQPLQVVGLVAAHSSNQFYGPTTSS